MKKFIILIFTFVLIFSSCLKQPNELDFSDIKNMNIGAEMPKVIYADEKKAIFFGCFGIIVYDLENRLITDRISEEFGEIAENGIYYECDASADGRFIYVSYLDFSFEENYDGYYHVYDTKNGRFKNQHLNYDDVEIFEDKYVSLFSCDENEKYYPYLDDVVLGHGMSETIAETECGFVALRSDTWNAKDLQVAVCYYETEKVEIFDLFEI
ncbi:MAG: hypothetical protein IKL18_05860 [Oscillospiraceae bacterium]|nr:hypothetical protein [Oscillospiraceae bacterium]